MRTIARKGKKAKVHCLGETTSKVRHRTVCGLVIGVSEEHEHEEQHRQKVTCKRCRWSLVWRNEPLPSHTGEPLISAQNS